MKIVITGKNGQVGKSLVAQLEKKSTVTFLALGREELDITDAEKVLREIESFNPDIIINSAAYTAVDNAEEDAERAFLINKNGVRNLAVAAKRNNAVMIHISTDYVFSGDAVGLYTEFDRENPQGVYGLSKLEGEKTVRESCPEHIILRTAWVFSEHGNNFVKTMLRLAKSRDSLGIVSDQFGGPTYAGDIASVLLNIAQSIYDGNLSYGTYHFSGYPHVSWYQFAEAIFKQAENAGLLPAAIKLTALKTDEYPTLAKRPANSKLDCKKIAQHFNVKQSQWQEHLQNIERYQ